MTFVAIPESVRIDEAAADGGDAGDDRPEDGHGPMKGADRRQAELLSVAVDVIDFPPEGESHHTDHDADDEKNGLSGVHGGLLLVDKL